MAIVRKPTIMGGSRILEPDPNVKLNDGVYHAVVAEIKDEFQREYINYHGQLVTGDQTAFLFGILDSESKIVCQIPTGDMNISFYPGSNLLKIIKGILGSEPDDGFEYKNLIGSFCYVKIENKTSAAGKVYPKVVETHPFHQESSEPEYLPDEDIPNEDDFIEPSDMDTTNH